MRQRLRLGHQLAAFLFCACSLLVSGAHAANTLSIKHSSGTTEVPLQPLKVAVLDWSVLDTLSKLGVEVAGIPSGNPPELLKQYRDARFSKVGTLFEPDFEALKSLQPDLIIIGRRAQGSYAEVAKYGPTIDLTPDARDLLGSVVNNTTILGQIFDKAEQAKALTDTLQASVERLNNLTRDQGTGLTLITTGGRMSAFGIGTRFGMIHDMFGVEPAVQDLKVGRHGQAVSFEFILEANPDWLFVMDRDAAIGRDGVSARQLMDNELVAATNAGSKGQIIYLDPVNWYLLDNSGVGVMQSSVETLIEAFSQAR